MIQINDVFRGKTCTSNVSDVKIRVKKGWFVIDIHRFTTFYRDTHSKHIPNICRKHHM